MKPRPSTRSFPTHSCDSDLLLEPGSQLGDRVLVHLELDDDSDNNNSMTKKNAKENKTWYQMGSDRLQTVNKRGNDKLVITRSQTIMFSCDNKSIFNMETWYS